MGRGEKHREGGGPRVATILAIIASIPRGSVCAYSDIDRHAPRLVGLVLARVGDEVPWQRVVHADGSAPMGPSQLELLRSEGVPMRGDRVDMARARHVVRRRRRIRERGATARGRPRGRGGI